jgi:hypothetical protein
MSTNTINFMAYADFEKASNAAGDLAERIGKCGRAGKTNAEMVELLKAWQIARHEARSSLERVLERDRARGGLNAKRTAKAG